LIHALADSVRLSSGLQAGNQAFAAFVVTSFFGNRNLFFSGNWHPVIRVKITVIQAVASTILFNRIFVFIAPVPFSLV